jgi:hypothetical protein
MADPCPSKMEYGIDFIIPAKANLNVTKDSKLNKLNHFACLENHLRRCAKGRIREACNLWRALKDDDLKSGAILVHFI